MNIKALLNSNGDSDIAVVSSPAASRDPLSRIDWIIERGR
jgi:hypothetical protein